MALCIFMQMKYDVINAYFLSLFNLVNKILYFHQNGFKVTCKTYDWKWFLEL